MSETRNDDLLARLASRANDGSDPWAALAATAPEEDAYAVPLVEVEPTDADAPSGDAGHEDRTLNELLDRIKRLNPSATASPSPSPKSDDVDGDAFVPIEPESLSAAGLTEAEVEGLLLKYLLSRGNSTGRDMADQVKLCFKIVEPLLRQIKADQLVVYRSTAAMNDYQYQLTDMGRERARRLSAHCTYFGAAPVTLDDYMESVGKQSLTNQHPTVESLHRAFDDLLLNKRILNRLGPAINSGRGLFLYGAPGNGKTSIAERVTKAFGQFIWIPRAIGVDGEIIRLYDPSNHEECPLKVSEGWLNLNRVDTRWVRIRRPTIVVGGELTLDALEVTLNSSTGICESPLQLKSNCGTLVIDDFGRQRVSTDALLNRWIVPLEKRYDFLNLPNGKKVQVPFDQLIVFSTNLEPKDLVDDAFLRRIPYKIDVADPTEAEFKELFKLVAGRMNMEYREPAVDYLITRHYRPVARPFRCCQPRDLLLQIQNFCYYQSQPVEMTNENFDFAVENYFAVM
jgi:hypothetical protein